MGKIIVLGATGMLGSAVFSLAQDQGLEVAGTTTDLRRATPRFSGDLVEFKGAYSELEEILSKVAADDFVINCIGLIKHNIDETSLENRERSIALNAVLPHQLDTLARAKGFRVVQIATDCVFSGDRGMYSETSPHDEGDVYGQTKSLGEVPSPQFMHIRTSIIGRELRMHRSLIDWALGQPDRARISGYTDHFWNGVTTVAFARVALGIIAGDVWKAGKYHLTPSDLVSKHELLRLILREFGRGDVDLQPTQTERQVDRTLVSSNPRWNESLWTAGRYATPPTIEQLVIELAQVQGVRE